MQVISFDEQATDRGYTVSPEQEDWIRRAATGSHWLVRAMGGCVRSYKRLKGTVADLACCVKDSQFSELPWDGLFFGVWSSALSEGLQWACRADRFEPAIKRCLWTRDIDPVHSIYLADPLTEAELGAVAEGTDAQRNSLVHAIAMNLLPWSAPTYWLLLLEAYASKRGTTKAQQHLNQYVPAWDHCIEPNLVPQLLQDIGGRVKTDLQVQVQNLASEEQHVFLTALPTYVDEDAWSELANLYQDPQYNRNSCLDVESHDADEIRISVKPGKVEGTYHYLTPSDEMWSLFKEMEIAGAAGSYDELVKIAGNHVMDHIPTPDPGPTAEYRDYLDLVFAQRRQREYFEAFGENHPEMGQDAAALVAGTCHLFRKYRDLIKCRVEDIVGFVKDVTQVVQHEKPIRLQRYAHCDKTSEVTVLSFTLSGDFVTELKEGQKGMPIHIYHLVQPGELLALVLNGVQGQLLHGEKGGLAIASARSEKRLRKTPCI